METPLIKSIDMENNFIVASGHKKFQFFKIETVFFF